MAVQRYNEVFTANCLQTNRHEVLLMNSPCILFACSPLDHSIADSTTYATSQCVHSTGEPHSVGRRRVLALTSLKDTNIGVGAGGRPPREPGSLHP